MIGRFSRGDFAVSHNRLLQLAATIGADGTDPSDSLEDMAVLAALILRLLWTERAGVALMLAGIVLVAFGVLQYLM